MRTVNVLFILVAALARTAWAGAITSESYATAYSQGLGVIFPIGSQNPQSGPTASFYFTGVRIQDPTSSSAATTFEGCAPATPVGNGGTGCPTSRTGISNYTDGTHTATGTATVSAAGDSESYTGTTDASAVGVDASGSFNITRTSGLATQTGSVNDYATLNEAFTVAPDATHTAGANGFLVLGYTVAPPNVTGTATGANEVWFGQWIVQAWMSTGTVPTNGWQVTGADLSTLSGPTVIPITIPFAFGSPVIVKVAYDVGAQWAATSAGAVSATASFDPLESLTSIIVEDASTNPIGTYSLTDSNGNAFGPGGLAVPEPSTYLLGGSGLVLLFLARRYPNILRRLRDIQPR